MSGLRLLAPAKLNLFLHVLGRRADGYHTIESLVVFADLVDELTFTAANDLSLSVSGEFAHDSGANEHNLVHKAARALQMHSGCARGAQITLKKNIPVGAGLGGGSADAAAALRGLNTLWQLGLGDEALKDIAIPLGADVAMCLTSRSAIVRGVGDEIALISGSIPAMAALFVHPRVPLLTKDVYAKLDTMSPVEPWPANTVSPQLFWQQLRCTKNHLQAPAIALSPLVAELLLALETLEPASQTARMTGSGACCFALYDTLAKAQNAAAHIAADYPDWWIKAVRIAS